MTADDLVRAVAALPADLKLTLALELLAGTAKQRQLGDAVLGLAYYQRRALAELAAALPRDRQALVDLQERLDALDRSAPPTPASPPSSGLGTDDPYRESPGRRGGRSCGD